MNLEQLLSQSMLLTAGHGHYVRQITDFNNSRVSINPSRPAQDLGQINSALESNSNLNLDLWPGAIMRDRSPRWRWTFDPILCSPESICLTDVDCQSDQWYRVCKRIEWHQVSLFLGNKEIPLPFDQKFFMRGHALESGGYIEDDASDLWRLESDVDSGFVLAFGYQFSRNGNIEPIERQIWPRNDLMEPVSVDLGAHAVQTNQANVFRLLAARVIVFVSWICCKARSDWDPVNAIMMSRFYPHLMVMTNFEIQNDNYLYQNDRIEASVSMLRPKRGGGLIHPHALDAHQHEIEPFLFTETNNLSRAIGGMEEFAWGNKAGNLWKQASFGASWDLLFDYYDTNPLNSVYRKDRYIVVDPAKNFRRESRGIVHYADRDEDLITKLPWQGDYDNIHLAAPMMAPLGWGDLPDERRRYWQLDKIIMSPICIHDCVHTHWRWNDGYAGKSNRGWSSTRPHDVAGAPLVPLNQRLSVEILVNAGDIGFRVDTTVQPAIKPCHWQVINCYGSGFPIFIKSIANISASLRETIRGRPERSRPSRTDDNIDGNDVPQAHEWWGFYWYLRYFVRQGRIVERVWVEDLALVRDL